MKTKLNELALFAGAGGGILGGKLLEWRTVCAVEWDAYARDVLVARQNDGCLDPFPIWDDVQTFDGSPWRGRVDVVSGGFPCQDISAAGKGAGIEGERSGMWKHMARIIGEVLPSFVLVENSPLLVGRGLGTVLADLASLGYDAEWGIVGAHHAGAPHKRERIWIVAHTNSARLEEHRALLAGLPLGSSSPKSGQKRIQEKPNVANTAGSQDHSERGDCECGRNAVGRNQETSQQGHGAPDNIMPCGCRGDVADTMRERSEAGATNPPRREERDAAKPVNGCDLRHAAGAGLPHGATEPMGEPGTDTESERSDWWATEPDVGRVAHGVACRVDRLRCIGNGQVPAVAALAWNILSGINQSPSKPCNTKPEH